jgi:hypothetical protein
MQHSAGVGWLDEPVSSDYLKDMDKFAGILAKQTHNFNGTKTRAYHAHSRGWYLNEIVRRVDPQHRTVGQIVSQEINGPFGVEWYYNPGPDLDHRVSKPYHAPLYQLLRRLSTPTWLYAVAEPVHEVYTKMQDKTSPKYKTFLKSPPDGRDIVRQQEIVTRRLESPSINGHTNARSVS